MVTGVGLLQKKQNKKEASSLIQSARINSKAGIVLKDNRPKVVINTGFEEAASPQSKPTLGDAVQLKIVARVTTEQKEDSSERVITELRMEGRAPTDVPGSDQGDHIVAEVLVRDSIIANVLHKTRIEALQNMLNLSAHTLPGPSHGELTASFSGYISTLQGEAGEDQSSILQRLIERYIELANKRNFTAFHRDEGLTTGGGGERKAIGAVRDMRGRMRDAAESDDVPVPAFDMQAVAENVANLVDVVYSPEAEDVFVAAIVKALLHSQQAMPNMSKIQRDHFFAALLDTLASRTKFPYENYLHLYVWVSKGAPDF